MRTPTRTARTAAAILAAAALTACGNTRGTTEPDPTATTAEAPVPAPSPTPDPTAPGRGTAILLAIGDTTVTGELWDNPAARDLAARLPLTLTFADFNAVEKIAALDPALTMDGMPAGDDPNPGEIGWFAPTSHLVLYYDDVGHWNGIARLGTFEDAGIDLLADGPREVTVTITADAG